MTERPGTPGSSERGLLSQRGGALQTFERDMQIARQIQASFLPEELPQSPGWQLAARFTPARDVAGDFYDAFTLSNNRRTGFVVADVCDKGVGAALFMSLIRTLIRAFAQQHYNMSWTDTLGGLGSVARAQRAPGAPPAGGARRRTLPSIGTGALQNAVSLTNNYLLRNHGATGMFATLFFGVLDPNTGALAYVNCGHNPPYLVSAAGGHSRLTLTGPAIGIMPDVEFNIQQAQLQPGDLLYAFTDGVTEARGAAGDFFGEARLEALLRPDGAEAVLERVEAALRDFTAGADQSDDITMLAVRRAAA